MSNVNGNRYRYETVTVKISKQFVNEKADHWWVEVEDIDGRFRGSSNAETFDEAMKAVRLIIAGDPEWEEPPNEWIEL
jgi:hypothetical protein